MELSPEQVALNGRVTELPVIIGLHEKNKKIIDDLEGLKEGQTILDRKVETGFEKGRKRMDGIEGELREVKDEVKSLTALVVNFISQSQINHNELKSEIQNGKIQELREELKIKRNEEDKKSAFRSGLTIGLTVLGISAVISAFGFLLTKTLWP
jgi:archaellum component FlaC